MEMQCIASAALNLHHISMCHWVSKASGKEPMGFFREREDENTILSTGVSLKGVSSPKILYCENVIQAPYNKTSKIFFLKKYFFLEFLAFRNQSYTSFCHNCHILKPELLLPKTTTVQIVNSSGFGMQQFWFKDVTVVAKRCVVLIPESQKFEEKDFLRRNK